MRQRALGWVSIDISPQDETALSVAEGEKSRDEAESKAEVWLATQLPILGVLSSCLQAGRLAGSRNSVPFCGLRCEMPVRLVSRAVRRLRLLS